MRAALAVLSGAIFGIGLLISGMTDPVKVIGFLDITRHWDPSLAFVMGGAVMINTAATRWILGRSRPLLDARFHLPTRKEIDVPLLVGAAIFGIGWGLGGLCPGPALVDAAAGATSALEFVAAMLAGMLLYSATQRPGTSGVVGN